MLNAQCICLTKMLEKKPAQCTKAYSHLGKTQWSPMVRPNKPNMPPTKTNPDRQETVYKSQQHPSQFDFLLSCYFSYKASWCRQFRSVLWRSWLTNNRDVVILRVRLFQCLVSVTIKTQFPFQYQSLGGCHWFALL